MSKDDVPDWVWEQDERERERIRNRLAGGRAGMAAKAAHDATPLNEVLAPLAGIIAAQRARMGHLVCRGETDRVGCCFRIDEAKCPEREAHDCPKRILEFEDRRKKYQGAPPDLQTVYEGFGIPRAIARTLLGSERPFEFTESVQKSAAWWSSKPRPRVLVLDGYSQIGKTVGAAALVATWSGKFIHMPTEFKNRVRDNEWQQRLLYPALVVFDDLGAEALDGFDELKGRFDGAFCARVDAGLWTVITTNSAEAIRDRYGARVAERINKHGHVEVIGEVAR